MRQSSKSLEETNKIAQGLLDSIQPHKQATVVALQGDLGAGKTAFVQEVGKILKINESLRSPTFVIEKIYAIDPAKAGQAGLKGFKNLIHIDAYRLEKDSELLHLGWEEIIKEPENLIFIEWPENVAKVIPRSARWVLFQFVDETTREIEVRE